MTPMDKIPTTIPMFSRPNGVVGDVTGSRVMLEIDRPMAVSQNGSNTSVFLDDFAT